MSRPLFNTRGGYFQTMHLRISLTSSALANYSAFRSDFKRATQLQYIAGGILN